MTAMQFSDPRKPAMAMATFAAVAAIACFWVHTGLDMYPLDDGWVGFSKKQGFDWMDFLAGNSRELRILPYMIAQKVEAGGFVTINLILIAINALTLLGLFRICQLLFRGRLVPAFFAAGLAMLFPNDHTMFWLGAFGVNISYLALAWSAAISMNAIRANKPWRQVGAMALLFCGIRTYPGYVFLPLILVSAFLAMQGGWNAYRRGFVRHVLPQWIVVSVALAPTVIAASRGSGREGRVASLDPGMILDGYKAMAANLGWRWMDDLWPIANWAWPYAVLYLALFSMTLLVLHANRRGSLSPAATAPRPAYAPIMVAGVALIALGYLPYAVSAVRFDAGRALIGSRFGFALLVVAAADWFCNRPRGVVPGRILAALGVLLLTLFCLNRLAIFDLRLERSIYQRAFLADLVAVVPCPPDKRTVIVIDQGEFSGRTTGTMLVNRPEFPIRAVYANRRLKAVAVSNPMLARGGSIDPGDGTIVYRHRDLGTSPLLLDYSYASGITHSRGKSFKVGPARQAVAVAGSPLPDRDCEPSPLARALLSRRAEYLDHLGLAARD
jgi:hypothetical protein